MGKRRLLFFKDKKTTKRNPPLHLSLPDLSSPAQVTDATSVESIVEEVSSQLGLGGLNRPPMAAPPSPPARAPHQIDEFGVGTTKNLLPPLEGINSATSSPRRIPPDRSASAASGLRPIVPKRPDNLPSLSSFSSSSSTSLASRQSESRRSVSPETLKKAPESPEAEGPKAAPRFSLDTDDAKLRASLHKRPVEKSVSLTSSEDDTEYQNVKEIRNDAKGALLPENEDSPPPVDRNSKPSWLQFQVQAESTRGMKCRHCQYRTKKASRMQKHVDKCHPNQQGLYACEMCPSNEDAMTTTSKDAFETHLRQRHCLNIRLGNKDVVTYGCDGCLRDNFGSLDEAREHLLEAAHIGRRGDSLFLRATNVGVVGKIVFKRQFPRS